MFANDMSFTVTCARQDVIYFHFLVSAIMIRQQTCTLENKYTTLFLSSQIQSSLIERFFKEKSHLTGFFVAQSEHCFRIPIIVAAVLQTRTTRCVEFARQRT